MRRDRERLPLPVAHYIEAAKCCGCGIIGMTLKAGADFENLLPLERTVGQFVQAANHAEANGDTAAKTTRDWDVSGDRTGIRERFVLRAIEKRGSRGANHRAWLNAATARDRYIIIEAKRDSKAVEPGSEIGCARRNSNGYLLHLVISAPAAMRRLNATQL